jgi:nucleotide-binding universal stress UspA family protein
MKMAVLAAVDGSLFSQWAIEWVTVSCHSLIPSLWQRSTALACRASRFRSFPGRSLGYFVLLFGRRCSDWSSMHARCAPTRRSCWRLTGSRARRSLCAGQWPTRLCDGPLGITVSLRRGIAAQVALYAPCSVLVVKQPPRPLRRVLLATDGLTVSDEALGFLCRRIKALLAHPHESLIWLRVDVVHLLPKFLEAGVRTMPFIQWSVDQLTRRGYSAEQHVLVGDPATEIQAAAARFSSDLILGGATGFGAQSEFFLGSVSTRVVKDGSWITLVVRGRHGRAQKT